MKEGVDFIVLSEALDALDRLFDGETLPADVQAILRLAGLALSDKELGAQLITAADRIADARRSTAFGARSVEAALAITDDVREPIADRWGELYR